MNLKYGQKVINAFTQKLEKIEQQIADIQIKIDELDAAIEKKETDFNMAAIESKNSLISERKLYANSLEQAKAHRLGIIDQHNDQLVADIAQEVDQALEKAAKENEKRLKKQKEKLNEFIAITKEVDEADRQLKADLNQTVQAIAPYVDESAQKVNRPFGRLKLRVEPSYKNFLSNLCSPKLVAQIERMAN